MKPRTVAGCTSGATDGRRCFDAPGRRPDPCSGGRGRRRRDGPGLDRGGQRRRAQHASEPETVATGDHAGRPASCARKIGWLRRRGPLRTSDPAHPLRRWGPACLNGRSVGRPVELPLVSDRLDDPGVQGQTEFDALCVAPRGCWDARPRAPAGRCAVGSGPWGAGWLRSKVRSEPDAVASRRVALSGSSRTVFRGGISSVRPGDTSHPARTTGSTAGPIASLPVPGRFAASRAGADRWATAAAVSAASGLPRRPGAGSGPR